MNAVYDLGKNDHARESHTGIVRDALIYQHPDVVRRSLVTDSEDLRDF